MTLRLLLLFLFASFSCFGKKKSNSDKEAIQQVLNTFMECIKQPDSIRFYNLFHDDPVVWTGVIMDRSHRMELQTDSLDKGYFKSTYKKFFRSLAHDGSMEEKFYNVQILHDEHIATLMFDYSFWEKNQKVNWGKESWGMVKVNGQWKISSVLFSLEFEKVRAEPE